MPAVAAPAAKRLALYATDGAVTMHVLAPRGWHCFATYGSNGSTLFVAPRKLDWATVTGGRRLRGPLVELGYSIGDTSGRFDTAAIAARLFPAAHAYVEAVEAEKLRPPFPRGPYPGDRISRHGRFEAGFVTAAGREGMGTQSLLAPDAAPVDGLAIFDPKGDQGATYLAVRLPAPLRPLAAPIIAEVRRQR